MNNISYDSLHQLRAALGSRSIMAEPSLKDLCVDGETFAGTAEDESVLHDWLDHIDSIIDKSLDAGESTPCTPAFFCWTCHMPDSQ